MAKTKQNKIRNIAICTLAGFLVVFFGYFVANADDVSSLNKKTEKEIDEKEDKLEELRKKAEAYRQIIELKKKQQTTITNQMEIMESEIKQLEIEIEANKSQISDLEEKIAYVSKRITDKQDSIDGQKIILSKLIENYYESDQQGITLLALGDINFYDLVSREDQMGQTGQKMAEILSNIKSLKESLEREKELLVENKNQHSNLKYQMEQRNDFLESSKLEKQRLAIKTQGEASKYKVLLSTVEEQQKAIENEIEELEEAQLNNVDLGALPPSKSGYFGYPVNPVKITQKYGVTKFSKTAYSSGKHNGTDFGISVGGSIYAAHSGKVIGVGDNGRYAYGKWVAIDHGDGLVTLYGHMSKQIVSKGKSVKQGDKIGLSGNTGFSTGPHLHFSVFAENTFRLVESKVVKGLMLPTGSSLDPMKYL